MLHNFTYIFHRPQILVEGNIGVGKTTLLSEIEKRYGADIGIVQESISKWQNFYGRNLLDGFYSDPKGNCFSLQSYIQLCSLQLEIAPPINRIQMFHRSIHANFKIFSRLGLIEKVLLISFSYFSYILFRRGDV